MTWLALVPLVVFLLAVAFAGDDPHERRPERRNHGWRH